MTLTTGVDGKKYQVLDGTWYHENTHPDVVRVLERVRVFRTRVHLLYGDPATAVAWEEGIPEKGYIGRSCGSIKIPLLVKTTRSFGGAGILTHCIVEIRETPGGRVLWRAQPKTKNPVSTE